MLNFNPATYWMQWWLDQFDGDAGAGDFSQASMRLTLAAQLAGLKAYREVVKGAQVGKGIDQMTEALKDAFLKTHEALAKQQPAVLKAHLSTLDSFIERMEDEVERHEKKEKSRQESTGKSGKSGKSDKNG